MAVKFRDPAATGEQVSKPLSDKKLFIKTYGCQMNVYDSARMTEILASMGYGPCDDPADADLVILNTCHIREKASEKVYSEIGRLRQLKDERARCGRQMLIAVSGCVAQAEGKEITRRAPAVDMVFGPQTYHRLPEMIGRVTARDNGAARQPVVETDFLTDDKFDFLAEELAPQGVSAFVTIQEGCDKFCTYCVVPYTRGAELSRPVSEVVTEARRLVDQGSLEITLLGQNVNAYHGAGRNGETWGLGRLIRHLGEIEGLERLRYTTSHPRDTDDELIAAHGEVPALMPFMHLPVQSGSDRVLAAMNRRHRADDYRRLVDRLRAARPDLALSSDFIVGFPGESDRDFEDTMKLVADTGFAQAYSFKYSPRPGTPSAMREDQVAESVKAERLNILQAELNQQQKAFNDGCVGTTMPVLFERQGRSPLQLVGRSPYMQAVHVELSDEAAVRAHDGRIAQVEITSARPNSLAGRLGAANAPAVLPADVGTSVEMDRA
ncbi:MAG: tRNA (N6-isopentenyl adenosine(37)-C2)-methylthiotransferase MiaB [Sphingomonadales bacterium]